MDNTQNDIGISKNTKLANKSLATAHFIIAIFYIAQQALIIRNILLFDDEITKEIVVDTMTYISIGISIILILTNIIAGIGIFKWKSWSWWLSASFFLYLAIENIFGFLIRLYTKLFLAGFGGGRLSLNEFDYVFNSLYISVIAIIVILFLNSDNVYIHYKKNIKSRRGSFFICLGIAILFIISSIVLSEISNFLL